ncbi:MAG: 23S rRNA (adenine(2503)-C(2))-methyltransferase RlmN [Planctomycetes bacterium]|nr:23S rRNA (adenine(2503)-C(2))-methyltransferase RlmN [Planctomycetota bacterium]
MTTQLPSLCELTRDELALWCQNHGEQPYRADQIRKWLFGKRVNDFNAMTDISAGLRQQLAHEFVIFSSEIATHQKSSDGTEKLLLRLRDGETTECVLMREDDRRTICISTQVGCGMGCVFCASGLLGLSRNLTTGEIVEEILRLDRLLPPLERITNVVVMGMGEPLANLPHLLKALATLDEKGGLGMSPRRITISTVGLPEKIRELSQVGKPYNLAISLHAPNDTLRSELVPVNRNIGIDAILAAADDFFQETGRRVTYEYVVLAERNDSAEQARELAQLLRGRNAHVNLIPMNSVSELPYHDPAAERLRTFVEILESSGVTTTVRKRKGADIDAACGQLRLRAASANVEPITTVSASSQNPA